MDLVVFYHKYLGLSLLGTGYNEWCTVHLLYCIKYRVLPDQFKLKPPMVDAAFVGPFRTRVDPAPETQIG